MSSLKRGDLEPLGEILQELTEFICGLHVEEIPYFVKFIECMRYNLEICLLVQYEDWEQLDYILRRDWSAANHHLIGIPDFDIQVSDLDKKRKLECRFLELINNVEKYLSH